ncbi:MAG: HPr family phosphocarrier protein, partial [Planctomycetota bacterium]|nr:HPr family phosphocarrier protein [Planctomycetota bacterium]
SEAEFRPLLASQAHDFLLVANGLMELSPEQWTQRQLVHLFQSATDLETYLDDFGAPDNRNFFKVRELVAVTRWLSVSVSSLVHLYSRIPSYHFPDQGWAEKVLKVELREAALSLAQRIFQSLRALREAWLSLGMVWPDAVTREESLGAAAPAYQLPRTRAEKKGERQENHASDAAQVAARTLRLIRLYDGAEPFFVKGLEKLQKVFFRYCTEEKNRKMESKIHNLQTFYDNQVSGSAEEKEQPSLPSLRGSISGALHLYEAGTALAHLLERHPGPLFAGDSERERSEEEFLNIVVNRCVLNGYNCLKKVEVVATNVLGSFTDQSSVSLFLPEGVSLHARPISHIVSIVNHHKTPVEVAMGDDSANASSIMQMLVMAGANPSCRKMQFVGDQRVLDDLAALFEARLGEGGFDLFPQELDYLRPS